MKNLKGLLKNGVFGALDTGEKFVVVGDNIVYQGGGWDCVSSLDDALIFRGRERKVEMLVTTCCFNCIDSTSALRILFDRSEFECVEMTVAEIEAKLGIKNLKIIKEDK